MYLIKILEELMKLTLKKKKKKKDGVKIVFSKAFEEISQNKNLNYKIPTSYVYNAPTCCNSLGEAS